MKKVGIILAFLTAVTTLTACGKDKNAETSEPTTGIKTYNEFVEVSTELATPEAKTTEPTTEAAVPIDYSEGKLLATIHVGDKTFPVKSGDNLGDTLTATGLKRFDWVMSMTELEAFSFRGTGYGFTDTSQLGETVKKVDVAYIYFEVTDTDKVVADNIETEPSDYKIAMVKTSLSDVNDNEFYVTYTEKNIKVGMTKAEIEGLLGTSDKTIGSGLIADDAIYYSPAENVVIFIDYKNDTAEKIYAMPEELCPLTKVMDD